MIIVHIYPIHFWVVMQKKNILFGSFQRFHASFTSNLYHFFALYR